MFPNRYFSRYYADCYWPPAGLSVAVAEPAPAVTVFPVPWEPIPFQPTVRVRALPLVGTVIMSANPTVERAVEAAALVLMASVEGSPCLVRSPVPLALAAVTGMVAEPNHWTRAEDAELRLDQQRAVLEAEHAQALARAEEELLLLFGSGGRFKT